MKASSNNLFFFFCIRVSRAPVDVSEQLPLASPAASCSGLALFNNGRDCAANTVKGKEVLCSFSVKALTQHQETVSIMVPFLRSYALSEHNSICDSSTPVMGASGSVLKGNTLQGKTVLKHSTCEVPWGQDTWNTCSAGCNELCHVKCDERCNEKGSKHTQ
jgi:hypothetical protein